jgi:hypothetical protein
LLAAPPPGFGIPPDRYREVLQEMDYLVVSYKFFSHQLLTAGDPVMERRIAEGHSHTVGTPGSGDYAAIVVDLRSSANDQR